MRRFTLSYIYQVRQKSNLKLFAVFSATAWNFSVKFYMFTCLCDCRTLNYQVTFNNLWIRRNYWYSVTT